MAGISLTSSMRANLSSLRVISGQMDKTQERLSTGLKVNSAIDNASSYYQARSLSNRASDLEILLDSMGQGIQTIAAANEGIEHATSILEQMSTITEQTVSEAKMTPMAARVEFKDNSAELAASGEYIGVSNISELKAALQQDGAKIVLLNDITSNETINMNTDGVKDIVINGGGHSLNLRSIYNYQSNTTIENVKLNMSNNDWWSRGIYSSQKISLKDIELSYTNTRTDKQGWAVGFDMRGGGTVENVTIKVKANVPTVSGIESWGTTEITNVSMDITGDAGSIIAGIGSHSKNLTIKDIGVKASGSEDVYGIIGPVTDITSTPAGRAAQGRPDALYNGKANTQAIVEELGSCGSAAKAATEFYAKADGSDQGDWYLPAIGEWMELYGTDKDAVTSMWNSTSGVTGENKALINATLAALKNAGVEAEQFTNGWYWSSSEAIVTILGSSLCLVVTVTTAISSVATMFEFSSF